jgi:Phosphotransferase enzyme family
VNAVAAESPLGADRPYPTRTAPLPRQLDEVTPPWLTGLLANRYPGIVVHDFETVEVKSSHTTKVRLRLDLNQVGRTAGIPEHVCLKCNWSGFRTQGICELEARFYDLLFDAGLHLPVPDFFYADWDDDGWGNGIVVMEDLAGTPGSFGASHDELGIDGVAEGLETLARVHASCWGDSRLESSTWLHPSMATPNDADQMNLYWNYIALNLADPAFADAVPEWMYDSPGLLHHALDELSAYELEHPGPISLVHGDAHQGNSFLRADGQRIWLDWQMVRKGHPVRDVEYFMVSSLNVDDRRKSDRDLVEHYRQALIAAGVDPVPSQEDTWQQFVRWPTYGAEAWLGNFNQWGQRTGAEMVKRHFSAAEDYGTFDMLTGGKKPRRPFVPGEGSYRLPRELQKLLDARLAGVQDESPATDPID